MQLINPSSAVFHRVGGLGLTTRFTGNELPDISDHDWKSDAAAVEISFSSGSALEAAVVVREFVPRYGDVTGRRYTDAQGKHQWVTLPAYGLVDPLAYLALVKQEIPKLALSWAAGQGLAHQEALRLIRSGEAPELETLLQYDFARYQKTGSAFITSPTPLGCPTRPGLLGGREPLPRMVTAQCDIVMNMYLSGLLNELFGDSNSALVRRFVSTSSADTHVAYVALRVIVEGTVWVLADKQRRDAENNISHHGLQIELQDSLNNLVGVFARKRVGMDYSMFASQLPGTAAAFYTALSTETTANGGSSWSSPLFWLPTLQDIVKKPFEPKTVF